MEPTVVRIRIKGGVIVQDCDIYIGRKQYQGGWKLEDSKWANPYPVKMYGRDLSLKYYENYIRSSPLFGQLWELAGKRLGCWCKPEACHGDILVKLFKEKYSISQTILE